MYLPRLLEGIPRHFIDTIAAVIIILAFLGIIILICWLFIASSPDDKWKIRIVLEGSIAAVAILTLFYAYIDSINRELDRSWDIIKDIPGTKAERNQALQYLGKMDKLKRLNLSPMAFGESSATINIDISEINLQSVNLTEADLRFVLLYKANLSKAILSGADLSDANLRNADLIKANLNGANLIRTNLTEADLTEVILFFADLFYTNLTDTNLKNAKLSASSFLGVDITRTKFDDSIIEDDPITPKIKNGKIPLSWIRKKLLEKEENFPTGTPDNWNDIPKPNYICNWDFDISEHIEYREVEFYIDISEEQLVELKEELKTILGDKCTLYEG